METRQIIAPATAVTPDNLRTDASANALRVPSAHWAQATEFIYQAQSVTQKTLVRISVPKSLVERRLYVFFKPTNDFSVISNHFFSGVIRFRLAGQTVLELPMDIGGAPGVDRNVAVAPYLDMDNSFYTAFASKDMLGARVYSGNPFPVLPFSVRLSCDAIEIFAHKATADSAANETHAFLACLSQGEAEP